MFVFFRRRCRCCCTVLREEFRLEPTNTRVAQGETALMECGPPRGTPEPTVSWRKNGQTLDLGGSKRIRLVDGGNLAIQDARQGDDGRYQCIVRNPAGVRESAVAYLKVHGKFAKAHVRPHRHCSNAICCPPIQCGRF